MMKKTLMLLAGIGISALVATSAFAIMSARTRAEHAGAAAIAHVKPAPVVEATPPAIKTIAKRAEVASIAAAKTPLAPKAIAPAPKSIGIDMSSPRCTQRPLGSGKPGEMVTVCE